MAEVTRKRRGEIIKKVFEILLQNPEGLAPKELFPQAEKSLTLSNYEKSDYPNRPGERTHTSDTLTRMSWRVKRGHCIGNGRLASPKRMRAMKARTR
jgi:hypothetical protein